MIKMLLTKDSPASARSRLVILLSMALRQIQPRFFLSHSAATSHWEELLHGNLTVARKRLYARCQLIRHGKKYKSTIATATHSISCQKSSNESLVVVGAGAAGIYGAIRAKTVAPNLNVIVIEKGRPLSKVKISGGGRCNVTNGHYCEEDSLSLAEQYPRGNKEFKGSFFNIHGPVDTMSWFSEHGVELKTEDDGRVFPVSNCSSTIIDCLMSEAKQRGVELQTGKSVTTVPTSTPAGNFTVKIEKPSSGFVEFVEAEYLLIATGSSRHGYRLAKQLGHSIIDPVPSLFTFKIQDSALTQLAGISFSKVKAKLKLERMKTSIPQQFTQIGPMLVTHWGFSGPVILRLSAWGARDLFDSDYKGTIVVDFLPDLHMDDVKSILLKHKDTLAKQKVSNSNPSEFGLVKRFWKYLLLSRQGLSEDVLWASISKDSLFSLASLLKQCSFVVIGKGQFKDEFVTAGGVPLSEISLATMQSRIVPRLFFAGEVLNIDGVTGGFNFQNAWSGGYIAGTTIGEMALRDVSTNKSAS